MITIFFTVGIRLEIGQTKLKFIKTTQKMNLMRLLTNIH